MSYIDAVSKLTQQSEAIASPPRRQLNAALRILFNNPVPGEPAFTALEVGLIGKYRITFATGLNDPIWQAIYSGHPEAWIYAIHEAAELQEFSKLGADPFVMEERTQNLYDAHLCATIFEIQYEQKWATHLGYFTSEMALEVENPLRNWIRHHDRLLEAIQAQTGWHPATETEQIAAQMFWNALLKGNL
jgi:hypothetical protein